MIALESRATIRWIEAAPHPTPRRSTHYTDQPTFSIIAPVHNERWRR